MLGGSGLRILGIGSRGGNRNIFCEFHEVTPNT